jgi:hypothetical protein
MCASGSLPPPENDIRTGVAAGPIVPSGRTTMVVSTGFQPPVVGSATRTGPALTSARKPPAAGSARTRTVSVVNEVTSTGWPVAIACRIAACSSSRAAMVGGATAGRTSPAVAPCAGRSGSPTPRATRTMEAARAATAR